MHVARTSRPGIALDPLCLAVDCPPMAVFPRLSGRCLRYAQFTEATISMPLRAWHDA